MKYKTLPKSRGSNSPNKRFIFENSSFFLLDENKNWDSQDVRYAGLSAFGFGGTNVHLILKEFAASDYDTYAQIRSDLALPEYNKQYSWPTSSTKVESVADNKVYDFFEIRESD